MQPDRAAADRCDRWKRLLASFPRNSLGEVNSVGRLQLPIRSKNRCYYGRVMTDEVIAVIGLLDELGTAGVAAQHGRDGEAAAMQIGFADSRLPRLVEHSLDRLGALL